MSLARAVTALAGPGGETGRRRGLKPLGSLGSVRVRTPLRALDEVLERLGEVVEAVLAKTGLTEDEFVAEFLAEFEKDCLDDARESDA